MKKVFDKNIKKAVSQLPQHEPREGLWGNIAQKLYFDDALKSKIADLPVYIPQIEAWEEIDKGIKYNKRRLSKNYTYWAAAASVAILIGIGTYFFKSNNENIVISEEISENWNTNESNLNDTTDSKLEHYFEAICKSPIYTQSEPELCEYNKHLVEINNNLHEIDNAIDKYGDSPSLITTRIKLQNQKAQIIKSMVNKLAS